MISLSSAVFLALFCVGSANDYFQTLQGNCSELQPEQNFDERKIAEGNWYYHYVSVGSEDRTCLSSTAIQRGNITYSDVKYFDKKTNSYVVFTDDSKYVPNKAGVHINADGVMIRFLATDGNSYMFTHNCLESNGTTEVTAGYGTRHRKLTEEDEKIVQQVSNELEKKNLLPKMHRVSQSDCPADDAVPCKFVKRPY